VAAADALESAHALLIALAPSPGGAFPSRPAFQRRCATRDLDPDRFSSSPPPPWRRWPSRPSRP
jgi:hypothetical protein